MKEFFLMYDDVRAAPSPRSALLEFLQSTYEAGANLAKWDRAELEEGRKLSFPSFPLWLGLFWLRQRASTTKVTKVHEVPGVHKAFGPGV